MSRPLRPDFGGAQAYCLPRCCIPELSSLTMTPASLRCVLPSAVMRTMDVHGIAGPSRITRSQPPAERACAIALRIASPAPLIEGRMVIPFEGPRAKFFRDLVGRGIEGYAIVSALTCDEAVVATVLGIRQGKNIHLLAHQQCGTALVALLAEPTHHRADDGRFAQGWRP